MRKFQSFYCLILFLTTLNVSDAQNPKIDSLKNVLSQETYSDKFNILWGLAYELFDVDNIQAFSYANEAYQHSLIKGDTLGIVMAGRITGQLLRRLSKLDESLRILEYVLPIAKRHGLIKEIKNTLTAIAVVYSLKAEYDKALKYNFECLTIREMEGNKKDISVSLMNIGVIYFKIDNFSLALDYYLRSLNAKHASGDQYDLDRLLIDIGICYIYLNKYDLAHENINRAFELCLPNCRNEIVMEGEHGLGNAFYFQKCYLDARVHFNRALTLSKIEDNQRYQIETLIQLTSIALIQREYMTAKRLLNEIELLPAKHQFTEMMILFYKLNADYYHALGGFKTANFFERKYSQARDEVFDTEMNVNLMRIQTQFLEKENLKQIESQSKILLLQGESIRKQKILNSLVGAIAIMIMGITMLLFKIVKEKQRINEILDLRVKERTKELERNRDDLKHAHDEQELILKKVSSDLTSSLATMKGLSSVATKDLPKEKLVYFTEAEILTERLVGYVKKYL